MVGMLQGQGLSHRQACHLASISRSVDKYMARNSNEALVVRMKELAFEYIHYGYRRIWALLKREGVLVSLKRVKRLCDRVPFSDPLGIEIWGILP
jgi:putative transposase